MPSQPLKMYVNFKSNVQAANTLIVGYPLWPRYLGASLLGTLTRTCVPSIAPIQFLKNG